MKKINVADVRLFYWNYIGQ